MESLDQSLLQPSDEATIPRIRLSELGYNGLKISSNQILEEANTKLRFPQIIKEVDEMRKDSSIAVALHLYRMMIGRVKWDEAPNWRNTRTSRKSKIH